MTIQTGSLLGFVDPSGMSLGFQIPLFSGGTSNAPLVQRISPSGVLEAFEPYEAPDAAFSAGPGIDASVGGPAIHAFAFGKRDVVIVRGDGGQDELLSRIDDPVLVARPMLTMEVAAFLREWDIWRKSAVEAHAELRRTSVDVADQWLDLSVLTPEIRSVLARKGGRTSSALATMVVGRVVKDVVQVLGLHEPASETQLAELRAATLSAINGLAALYPKPPGGWRVQIHTVAEPPVDPDAQAAVLLASHRARELAHGAPWPAAPRLDIHLEDGIAFTRIVEETDLPLFVAYDADESEAMYRTVGVRAVRAMHGIALGSGSRFDEAKMSQPWGSTHVPASALGGSRRGAIMGIRLAVAAELDRRERRLELHNRSVILLRARGAGPDPETDAWAALYDRAWGMGLAPWRALLIPGPDRGHDLEPKYSRDYSSSYMAQLEPGWAARALFEEPNFLEGASISPLMVSTRTTAAALVPMERRRETDLLRHRASVTRLLERQRWSIIDHNFRDPDALVVFGGGRTEFQLMVRSEGVRQPEWQRSPPLETDLLSAKRLLASGSATPGLVLKHLHETGELIVGMRDLARLDAAEATPLSIVAAQLQRMVTGLPSRARTHFIALVTMQALMAGNVDGDGRILIDMIESPDFGRRLHFAISSTASQPFGLSARIRIIQADLGPGPGRRRNELGGFILDVLPDLVRVSGIDHDDEFGRGVRRYK